MKYILSIDQSTSCTKALLFDEKGLLIAREDLPHRQIINERGWVEHDAEEIYRNLIQVVKNVIDSAKVNPKNIVGAGLSNQRETSLVWNRKTSKPYYNAIVWQCGRAVDICNRLAEYKDLVKEVTGMNLSPYFSAAKLAWILQNVDGINKDEAICSTIDSYLIFRLSKNSELKTDYSNACRTQLFNIKTLKWDTDMLKLFGIEREMLCEVCDSDSIFCLSDFDGVLPNAIPIHSVLGDSQAALFAQSCLEPGMVKATYGTGSSVMMNTGLTMYKSNSLVSSLAWCINGKINYVLEGNINYSGALIKWLIEDLQLIKSAKDVSLLAREAKELPKGFYVVPAFTGLGAPYWEQKARALICGMDRTVGKAELVKACEEAIALQITDILKIMEEDTEKKITALRVDGGPSKDSFLMQIQSDFADVPVRVSKVEELSGEGVAFVTGFAMGIYSIETITQQLPKAEYYPLLNKEKTDEKYQGWKKAVECSVNYQK